MHAANLPLKPLERPGSKIIGSFIDAGPWGRFLSVIISWAMAGQSRVVCVCNVHSVVTAKKDRALRAAIEEADIATPDGMPLVWVLRQRGFSEQERINGPDLMWRVLSAAETQGVRVFFYGATEKSLQRLCRNVRDAFPNLPIAGSYSPPFRVLTEAEQSEEVERINAAEAQVVFVGLGCPKQEVWMHHNKGRIKAVMLGVGAAFDFHAGMLKRAPLWFQNSGLEWFYRLIQEPRRLFFRYATTNSLFIWNLLMDKFFRSSNRA
ncbi:MAG: WecB/TagA/CpsF family glycosyltransferase [Desulfomicrobium sp.]|nr:WecB/TagA/CpsF family glycosyltransferase [Desulfomicrobium sp.]